MPDVKNNSLIETTRNRLSQGRERALGSPWLQRSARFGYFAKGFVYALVGVLGIRAALGAADETLGLHGALQALVRGPLGSLLLILVGVGLGSYVLWRFVQAVVDPEGKGTGAKALILRATYAVSGAIFGRLAFEAVELVVEWGEDPRITAEDWTRMLLAWSFGRWLVGIVGAIVIGAALRQFYVAYKATFRQKFNRAAMTDRQEQWVFGLGRAGHAARGIVFLITGGFLVAAAIRANARMAGGISDALLVLAAQPFGPWLLGIVAFGLLAYGLYEMAEARYRRIIA